MLTGIRSKKLRSQPNISNMLTIGDGLYMIMVTLLRYMQIYPKDEDVP